VRVDSDFSATPFKAKIADAEQTRVHTMRVIGARDIAEILANIKRRKS
jgi:threonyl-tRNA synthetase